MTDPSPTTPEPTTPDQDAPPFPEIDPAGAPEESPPPVAIPDDGLGRPVDGSVLAAG